VKPIRSLPLVAASFAICVAAGSANAQVDIRLEPFVEGVNAPLAMVQPPGDDRFFIIEQWGRVRIADANGQLQPEPFLDIRNKIVTLWPDFDERGLLGIAFHPDFQENGRFYVAYSTHTNFQGDLAKLFWWDHTNVVAEYRVSEDDPDVADLGTERIIHSLDWPQFNHNGHWIGFGPDGMLYISTGDGGYANDWGIGHNVTEGNGQDRTNQHGNILRVDVNTDNGEPYSVPDDNPFTNDPEVEPEIWAYGLRNPWRCSFDMEDGRLFCGDVQQNSYEEVNIIEAGDNLGWRRMEATHCFDYAAPDDHPADCDKEGLKEPILEYENCTARPQNCMGISVTGGYVYRGSNADWQGKYIFGDWSKSFAERDGQIFIATQNGDSWSMEVANVTNMDENLPYVLAFAQDADGEVYALTSVTTGPVGGLDTIYRIVPAQ
jgi:glucose/arabinose dehydrogenase